MLKYNRLDRRQAVRHWVLVPAFAGSNPADPATEIMLPKSQDLGIFCLNKLFLCHSYNKNCIPLGFKNMTEPDYKDFLLARRKLMAKKIHTYFDSL